jgi:hypothetical protein
VAELAETCVTNRSKTCPLDPLPNPTALPAAASKTPIFDENDFIMRQKYKKNAYAITVQANF